MLKAGTSLVTSLLDSEKLSVIVLFVVSFLFPTDTAGYIKYSGNCLIQHLYNPELSRSDIISVHSSALYLHLTEYCRSVTIVTNPQKGFLNHQNTLP